MQGDARVIEMLNDVLTGELTGVNQYFVHSRMCGNWGYERLEKKIYEESIEEMKHADYLIKRVLFLEGTPNLQRLGNVLVGENVPEQFERDLALEQEAVARVKAGIALCLDANDPVSRELLEHILVDEEEHVDWLETQQEAIRQVGLENYLAEQLHE